MYLLPLRFNTEGWLFMMNSLLHTLVIVGLDTAVTVVLAFRGLLFQRVTSFSRKS